MLRSVEMSSENKEITASADYSQYSDEELLKGCDIRLPDSDRISELVARYMKTVFAYAAKYSAFADYEELASDGMQGLLDAIRSFDLSKGRFSTYASACISNRMKNTAKRSASRSSHISDSDASLEQLESIADPSPSPEDVVLRIEDDKMFYKNLSQALTELELRCIDGVILGFSYDEIAEMLSTDRKSVDNALTRARTKLRRLYKI